MVLAPILEPKQKVFCRLETLRASIRAEFDQGTIESIGCVGWLMRANAQHLKLDHLKLDYSDQSSRNPHSAPPVELRNGLAGRMRSLNPFGVGGPVGDTVCLLACRSRLVEITKKIISFTSRCINGYVHLTTSMKRSRKTGRNCYFSKLM